MRRSDSFGALVGAIVALVVVATLVVVVLPASDADTRRPSARACEVHPGECGTERQLDLTHTITVAPADASGAAARNDDSSWARGRGVYIREGCYYCHTQQIRPVLGDAGLGPVTTPGDEVFQDPPLLGSRRVGPDLANVGSRSPFTGCDATVNFLKNPRSVHPWSSMPSYDHLGGADLTDLATYLVRLRPASGQGPPTCDPREPGALTPTVAGSITSTITSTAGAR